MLKAHEADLTRDFIWHITHHFYAGLRFARPYVCGKGTVYMIYGIKESLPTQRVLARA